MAHDFASDISPHTGLFQCVGSGFGWWRATLQVIVFDADFAGIAGLPTEHDAVLIVYADAVASSPISLNSSLFPAGTAKSSRRGPRQAA
jgi:hypothetical protein